MNWTNLALKINEIIEGLSGKRGQPFLITLKGQRSTKHFRCQASYHCWNLSVETVYCWNSALLSSQTIKLFVDLWPFGIIKNAYPLFPLGPSIITVAYAVYAYTNHNILIHTYTALVGIHRGAVSGHSSECACHLRSTHQWQLHKPSQVSQPLPHVSTQPNCKYASCLTLSERHWILKFLVTNCLGLPQSLSCSYGENWKKIACGKKILGWPGKVTSL